MTKQNNGTEERDINISSVGVEKRSDWSRCFLCKNKTYKEKDKKLQKWNHKR